jgi:hypothetical protein
VDPAEGSRKSALIAAQAVHPQTHLDSGCGNIGVVIIPQQHVHFAALRVATAFTSGTSATLSARTLFKGRAPLLSVATHTAAVPGRPPSIPSILKAFSTGLSMPSVANERNPAKAGWSSNSKAQVTAPSTVTP